MAFCSEACRPDPQMVVVLSPSTGSAGRNQVCRRGTTLYTNQAPKQAGGCGQWLDFVERSRDLS